VLLRAREQNFNLTVRGIEIDAQDPSYIQMEIGDKYSIAEDEAVLFANLAQGLPSTYLSHYPGRLVFILGHHKKGEYTAEGGRIINREVPSSPASVSASVTQSPSAASAIVSSSVGVMNFEAALTEPPNCLERDLVWGKNITKGPRWPPHIQDFSVWAYARTDE